MTVTVFIKHLEANSGLLTGIQINSLTYIKANKHIEKHTGSSGKQDSISSLTVPDDVTI